MNRLNLLESNHAAAVIDNLSRVERGEGIGENKDAKERANIINRDIVLFKESMEQAASRQPHPPQENPPASNPEEESNTDKKLDKLCELKRKITSNRVVETSFLQDLANALKLIEELNTIDPLNESFQGMAKDLFLNIGARIAFPNSREPNILKNRL